MVSDWGAVKARLVQYLSGFDDVAGRPLEFDIRAALDRDADLADQVDYWMGKELALRQRVEELEAKLQVWSDWEAMLHAQLERVVGGGGRGCDSLVETLRLRLHDREREIDRKERGYAAIIKMERDARDQFRERAEAAEAEVERLREALRSLLDREELDLKHAYTTCDVGDSTNADRGCVWCVARAVLRGEK